jgi:hypothetical protein
MRPPVIQPLSIDEVIQILNRLRNLQNVPHAVSDKIVDAKTR